MIAEYLRKSRAEELMDSDDEVLEKHRKYLADFAAQKRIFVDDFYEEVVSGESIAARPQMQKLLKSVKAGKYHAVLCMDIDRLGRGGMQDQGAILDAFRDTGTLIITPDKTYDLSNEQDEMLTEFKSFMSRQEYKIIRKRMRRGLMQTIQAGGYVANPPYGYRPCKVGKHPSLEIVPEEAEFIKHIYRRYQEGVGSATIAVELNAMGSVPRRNGQWCRSTVRLVLRNPVYKGMVAWNRVKRNKPGTEAYTKQKSQYMKEDEWILAPGLHPAIIPPAEWDKVQEIRVKRYIPRQNVGQTTNPFAGLIVCSVCGRNMQRMEQHKGVPYLLCNTKGCCAGAKFEFVEAAIYQELALRLTAMRTAPDHTEDRTAAEEAAVAAMETELSKIDTRLSRLYNFLEDGTYDRATFVARRASLEEKRRDLTATLTAAKSALSHRTALSKAETEVKLTSLLDQYKTMTPGEINMLLKEILEKIVYTKRKKTKPADFTLEIVSKNFLF